MPSDFLKKDIQGRNHTHIIFATENQLKLIAKAKNWLIDATTKVVWDPCMQLMSIHAFRKKDDDCKQVPLAFAMMSHCRKKYYKKILKVVKEMLLRVTKINLDFDQAAWTASAEVFWYVVLQGNIFHWTQAVYRHVQKIGLGPSYLK